jgi:hypothetical protein
MQHGCLCCLVLCRFKLGSKMPLGMKPGGSAVVPVWFNPFKCGKVKTENKGSAFLRLFCGFALIPRQQH